MFVMKQIIILILVLIIAGCTPQKFILTGNPKMTDTYRLEQSHEWVNMTISDSCFVMNKTIYLPPEVANIPLIYNTLGMLYKKEYKQIDKYLNSVGKDHPYLPLTRGLEKIFKKDFVDAIKELKKNRVKEIQYIVDFLILDCLEENDLNKSNCINYNYYLEKYQWMMDNYELSKTYIKLINNRLRFIRYEL